MSSSDVEIEVYYLSDIYVGSLSVGDEFTDLVDEKFEKKLKGAYAEYHQEDEDDVTEDDLYSDDGNFDFQFTYAGRNKEELTLSDVEELLSSDVFDGDYSITAFEFLFEEIGHDVMDAINSADDVSLFEGTLEEYAREFVNDVYDIPANLSYYFDYDSFGSDLEREGSVVEYGNYVITNAGDF